MCGRIKRLNKINLPGSKIQVITKDGVINMIWGFNQGKLYNVRSEKFYTLWKKYNKNLCLVEVDSFIEGKGEFTMSEKFYLAGLYNKQGEFALLTKQANETIKKYHHRMPVIIKNIDTFFNDFKIAA